MMALEQALQALAGVSLHAADHSYTSSCDATTVIAQLHQQLQAGTPDIAIVHGLASLHREYIELFQQETQIIEQHSLRKQQALLANWLSSTAPASCDGPPRKKQRTDSEEAASDSSTAVQRLAALKRYRINVRGAVEACLGATASAWRASDKPVCDTNIHAAGSAEVLSAFSEMISTQERSDLAGVQSAAMALLSAAYRDQLPYLKADTNASIIKQLAQQLFRLMLPDGCRFAAASSLAAEALAALASTDIVACAEP